MTQRRKRYDRQFKVSAAKVVRWPVQELERSSKDYPVAVAVKYGLFGASCAVKQSTFHRNPW